MRAKHVVAVALVVAATAAGMALGQDAGAAAPAPPWQMPQWMDMLITFLMGFIPNDPRLVPAMMALMALCRMGSEMLLIFADRVQGAKEAESVLATVMTVLAKLLAVTGVGMPDKLVMDKAHQIALQTVSLSGGASAVQVVDSFVSQRFAAGGSGTQRAAGGPGPGPGGGAGGGSARSVVAAAAAAGGVAPGSGGGAGAAVTVQPGAGPKVG